ncbi:MAG: carboxypeptidase regulatory-like domain-containing protein [Coriobacteriia bacterium]|nr:carboxypeptidase regulatory-like domain-containing protein [Coriobacteriia bacterium]
MTVRSLGRPGIRLGALVLVTALAALLAFGGATALAVPAPPARTISGHVTDTGGHPVDGVVVSAWTSSVVNGGTSTAWSNYVTTDANGAYKIPDLAPANYAVKVDLASEPFLVPVPKAAGDVTAGDAGVNFSIPVAGEVDGRAEDTHGAPLAGAHAFLVHQETWGWSIDNWAETGADGKYEISQVKPGDYSVMFDQWAWSTPESILVSPVDPVGVHVAERAVSTGPTGVFEQGASITGTMVDGETGFPICFQILTATREGDSQTYNGFSQPDGSFVIDGPAGIYTITSWDENEIFDSRTIVSNLTVLPGQQVALGPCPVTSSRTDVHYITGRVTDHQTGEPVLDSDVSIDYGSVDGLFVDLHTVDGRFAILAKGPTADLPAPHVYYLDVFTNEQDSSGIPLLQYVSLTHKITVDDKDVWHPVTLQEGGRISGRVTDGRGHGIGGVPVEVSGYSGGTSGYPGGTSGYPGGTSGYPGGTSGYPGGTSGYPGGTSGYPNVTSGYNHGVAVTDSDGRYLIGALRTGPRYRVVFNRAGIWSAPPVGDLSYAYHNHPFFDHPTVVSGYGGDGSVSGYDPVAVTYNQATRRINQAIPRSGEVKFVADSADHPLGGIEVLLDYQFRGSWVRAEDAFTQNGTFDSSAIPPGRYRVSWRDYFGRLDGSGDVREFRITAGQNRTIQLVSASAGGTAHVAAGKLTGALLGAAGTQGVFSAHALAVVPNPGGLPVGTRQLPGGAYDLGFSGPYFGTWTLTFPYGTGVSNSQAAQITVDHFNTSDGTWAVLVPTSVDVVHHTVTVKTETLSPFVLSVPAPVKAKFSAPVVSANHPYVGDPVSIATTLTNSVDGTPLTGRSDVTLQSSTNGGAWTPTSAFVTAGAAGAYSATVVPTGAGTVSYRFTMPSYAPNVTGGNSAAVSVTAKLSPTSWSAAALVTGGTQTIVPFGGSVVASATLRDRNGAAFLPTATVVVQSSANGTAFVNTALVATRVAPGVYHVTLAPAVKTYYRFTFAGDAANAAAQPSSAVFVAPQVALGDPTAAPTASAGKAFTVSGTLSPATSPNAKTVQIYYERQSGSVWNVVGNVWATNAPNGSSSTYSASFKLSAGVYRFRALAPEDA